MKPIRFWISLWGGKFFLWLYKKTGRRQNDRPGMAAMKLYGDFLKYVKKPPLTIVVTGTNGKTSVSSMVADLLRLQGLTVSYNDWGANHHAGVARCLLDGVSIFNRSTVDAAVVEMDELISREDVPALKPQYLIVNNLARDSMLRNAHPGYVLEHIRQGAANSPDTTVILNGDDPLSCFMGEGNRRFYFGVSDRHSPAEQACIDDFPVCPRCGGKPGYRYRNYRQIGDFRCPDCGLASPERDYFVTDVAPEQGTMTLREPDGTTGTYPIVSASVHQVYNAAAIVTLMRLRGIEAKALGEQMARIALPTSRESHSRVKGIQVITQACKGQNATAASTVFAALARDPEPKDVVLLLDEVFSDPKKIETVAWLWDTDYEYFASPSIHKVIVGGARYLDHRLRLSMAGVPQEKFQCMADLDATADHVSTQGISKIYVLHDVTLISRGRRVRDAIVKRLEETT